MWYFKFNLCWYSRKSLIVFIHQLLLWGRVGLKGRVGSNDMLLYPAFSKFKLPPAIQKLTRVPEPELCVLRRRYQGPKLVWNSCRLYRLLLPLVCVGRERQPATRGAIMFSCLEMLSPGPLACFSTFNLLRCFRVSSMHACSACLTFIRTVSHWKAIANRPDRNTS